MKQKYKKQTGGKSNLEILATLPTEKETSVERQYYSAYEAAEIIGFSRTGVYELLRQRKIKHVRVGRRVLISKAALDRFLTELTVSVG